MFSKIRNIGIAYSRMLLTRKAEFMLAQKYPCPSVGALFACGKLGATESFKRIQKLRARGPASPVWHWTYIILRNAVR